MLGRNPLAAEIEAIDDAWSDGVNWLLWLRMGCHVPIAVALLQGLHRPRRDREEEEAFR